jgi:hypothetical protein
LNGRKTPTNVRIAKNKTGTFQPGAQLPAVRRDQRAFLLRFTGCRSALCPSRPRRFRSATKRARHERHFKAEGSAGFPPAVRRRSFTEPQAEATSQRIIVTSQIISELVMVN